MSETAFDRWWGEDDEPDYEGVRQAAMDAWEASREVTAAEVQAAVDRLFAALGHPDKNEWGSEPIGEAFEELRALAARLRGLA